MSGEPRITAQQIVDLLSRRHSRDVFVSECKNGPSYESHVRIDGWAMKKSYTRPVSYGYEIKVSRSDFLNDDKWAEYLKYCNVFSFVSPHGLIQPEELPEGVGLLYVSRTGSKLYTKRKAAHRDVEIPENFYRYLIFSRMVVSEDAWNEPSLNYWRRWLEQKEERMNLGSRVSYAIANEIREARSMVRHYKFEIEKYEGFKRELREMGLDPDSLSSWSFRREVNRVYKGADPEMIPRVAQCISTLEELLKRLKEAEE